MREHCFRKLSSSYKAKLFLSFVETIIPGVRYGYI